MPTLDTRLDSARKRTELERLRLQERFIKHLRNDYDFADHSIAQRKRRKLTQDQGKSEDAILDRLKRNRGIAFCRDLYRNSAGAQSIARQIRNNVVGTVGGKVSAQTGKGEWDRLATKHFNTWARDCGYQRPARLNKILRMMCDAYFTDGDFAFTDDPELTGGKVRIYDSDHIAPMKTDGWDAYAKEHSLMEGDKPLTQENGAVRDSTGKITHIIITPKPSFAAVDSADAAVLSIETARFCAAPWRANQYRGVPMAGIIALEMEDIKEMRSRELDTAKVAATMAMTIARKDMSAIESALRDAGKDPGEFMAAAEALAGGDEDSEAEEVELPDYKNLKELAGGLIEYLDPGDSAEPLKFDRPNLDVGRFAEYVHKSAGAGLGMAGAFASWSADKSYFAFQGDMILTWPTFEEMQKDLEYDVCDWLWQRVIQRAIDAREIPKGPDGWQHAAAWSWPQMPQADKVKYWNSVERAMRVGGKSFSDILGPDWEKRIEETARQAEVARELMPWLSLFETKAGAPLADAEEKDNEQN